MTSLESAPLPGRVMPKSPEKEMKDEKADPFIRAVRACQFGQLSLLLKLVDSGVKINDRDSEGQSLGVCSE